MYFILSSFEFLFFFISLFLLSFFHCLYSFSFFFFTIFFLSLLMTLTSPFSFFLFFFLPLKFFYFSIFLSFFLSFFKFLSLFYFICSYFPSNHQKLSHQLRHTYVIIVEMNSEENSNLDSLLEPKGNGTECITSHSSVLEIWSLTTRYSLAFFLLGEILISKCRDGWIHQQLFLS